METTHIIRKIYHAEFRTAEKNDSGTA